MSRELGGSSRCPGKSPRSPFPPPALVPSCLFAGHVLVLTPESADEGCPVIWIDTSYFSWPCSSGWLFGAGFWPSCPPSWPQWLPPGDDGRVSLAMAHLKRQSAASSLLHYRASQGLDPEREDLELTLEQYMPTSLELAALWPESLRLLSRTALTRAPTATPALTTWTTPRRRRTTTRGCLKRRRDHLLHPLLPRGDSDLQGTDCNG